jgi:hypothetical protein
VAEVSVPVALPSAPVAEVFALGSFAGGSSARADVPRRTREDARRRAGEVRMSVEDLRG